MSIKTPLEILIEDQPPEIQRLLQPSPVVFKHGSAPTEPPQQMRRHSDQQRHLPPYMEALNPNLTERDYFRWYRLPDGRRALLIVQGGVERWWIEEKRPEGSDDEPSVFIEVNIHDYVCGVVRQPTIEEQEDDEGNEYDAIGDFESTTEGLIRIPDEIAERKLAVGLPDIFVTLADSEAMALQGVQFSEHRRVKAGKYTGYMRQVVQLLLGFGHLFNQTYEQTKVEEGEIDFIQPDEPTPNVGSVAEVRFDYRWTKTHGLGWGSDFKTWVIQIGYDGVYALPLLLEPVSLTEEGRERYKYLYPELFVPDLSGEGLFDLLGGFPLPMDIPYQSDLEAQVNAGEVIKLLDDVSDFYSKTTYANSQGWAFAERMPVAVNTCWHYGEGGIKEGFLFSVEWNLGVFEDAEPTTESEALAEAIAAEGLNQVWRARKCHRMTEAQRDEVYAALDNKDNYSDEEEWFDWIKEQFDAIVVEPPMEGSAKLTELQRGWLYHPSIYEWPEGLQFHSCTDSTGHPQIKFPNEELGYNNSFNFEPADRDDHEPPERCDTPMWACWVNDKLMVVNYYWQGEERQEQSPQNTRGPCQFTGTWVEYYPGSTATKGNFYSNFFDLRRTVRDTAAKTVTTSGAFVGTSDRFSFEFWFSRCACITRHVYFQDTVATQADEGGGYQSSLAIPFGDRSVIYSAELKRVNNGQTSVGIRRSYSAGTTGYKRYGRIYEFLCHWAGCYCSNPNPAAKIIPEANPCVMAEVVPMSFSKNCLSGYGMPDFPHYQPCEESPTASGTVTKSDDAPLNCALNGTFNDNTTPSPTYSESSEVITTFEWVTRIWGDVPIHGRKIQQGSVSGPEVTLESDVPISYWWWLSSPVCSPPVYCKFEVGFNRFGHRLGNYHDDVDPFEVLHDGGPNNMHADPSAVFVGYVSKEVFDR
jgi:hypothetical protein